MPQMIESRFKIILTSCNNGPKPQDEIPQVDMQSPVFGLEKNQWRKYTSLALDQ